MEIFYALLTLTAVITIQGNFACIITKRYIYSSSVESPDGSTTSSPVVTTSALRTRGWRLRRIRASTKWPPLIGDEAARPPTRRRILRRLTTTTTTEEPPVTSLEDDETSDEDQDEATTVATISATTTRSVRLTHDAKNGKYPCGTIPKFGNSVDWSHLHASPFEIPWQVRVIVATASGARRSCGGILIGNNNTVVTAANCFDGVNRLSNVKVILGAIGFSKPDEPYQLEPGQQEVGVTHIFKHRHLANTSIFDIAVVKIQQVKLSEAIIPACLPDTCRQPVTMETCFASGWKTAMNESVPQLQKAPARLIKRNTRCGVIQQQRSNIGYYERKHLLCAKTVDPQRLGYCHADMGGPLVCNGEEGRYVAEGILSTHTSCIYGSVDIYFRICKYSDWIENLLYLLPFHYYKPN